MLFVLGGARGRGRGRRLTVHANLGGHMIWSAEAARVRATASAQNYRYRACGQAVAK